MLSSDQSVKYIETIDICVSTVCKTMKNAVLDAIVIHRGTFTIKATPVRLGSSRHTSTDDWVHIRREIVGLVIGVVDISYYSTGDGRISDM